jgi:hypothetical protein
MHEAEALNQDPPGKRQKREEDTVAEEYVIEAEGKVIRVDKHGRRITVEGQRLDLVEADGDSSQYEYVEEEDHGSLAADEDDSAEDEDEDSLEDDEITGSEDDDEYNDEACDEGCDLLMDKLDLPDNLSPQFYQFYEEFTTQMDFIIKYEYNLRPSVPAAYSSPG